MSRGFERLPDYHDDETTYYGRASLDLTESSYADYRPKTYEESTTSLINRSKVKAETEIESEDNSAPLGKSVKQYSTLVWWMLAMATAILYGGYDSVVLGALNVVPAYEHDFGEYLPDPEDNMELKWTIPAFWLGLWDGIGPLGQMAGAALGGWLVDRKGRRFCLLLGSIIGAVAILILFLSNMPANKNWMRIMILIGKIVQGAGLGLIKIETFTYMSEIIPVSLKGPVMSLVPTFTLLGQLLGSVVVFTVKSDKPMSYMIAIGSQWVLALPPFLLSFLMPESPAYLIKERKTHDALTSFTRLLGPKNNPGSALLKLETTLEEEAKNSAKISYTECFNAANRRRTLIVIFASSIEFFFGLGLLSNVSTFLKRVGMDSSKSILFLIGGILFGLIANAISSWTITYFGRRKLILTTLLITCGLWTVMGLAGFKKFSFTPWLTGGLCTAVVVTVGVGCWPASYAVLGETSSVRLRSKSQAIGSFTNNILGVATNFGLPYFYNPDGLKLGAKSGFLYSALSLIGAILTYFYVPELKGRSALEIDHFFAKGISARGSTNWRPMHEGIPMGRA